MRKGWRLQLAAGLALPLFTACGEPDCFGWKVGHKYSVELIERYDENSSFEFVRGGARGVGVPCSVDIPPFVGDTFWVTPTDLGEGHFRCASVQGNIKPLPPLEEIEHIQVPSNQGDLLVAVYEGTLEGCEASWTYRFYSNNTGITSVLMKPIPTKIPPLALERTLGVEASGLGCDPIWCTDRFVVQVRE